MTTADEAELPRITSLLESMHDRGDLDARRSEALRKGALALSVAFIHGLRPEVERLYAALD